MVDTILCVVAENENVKNITFSLLVALYILFTTVIVLIKYCFPLFIIDIPKIPLFYYKNSEIIDTRYQLPR